MLPYSREDTLNVFSVRGLCEVSKDSLVLWVGVEVVEQVFNVLFGWTAIALRTCVGVCVCGGGGVCGWSVCVCVCEGGGGVCVWSVWGCVCVGGVGGVIMTVSNTKCETHTILWNTEYEKPYSVHMLIRHIIQTLVWREVRISSR